MARIVGRPKGSKSPRLKLKPEEKKRNIQRQIRLTIEEDEKVQEAIEIENVTISQFIRDSVLEKAEKVIRKNNK